MSSEKYHTPLKRFPHHYFPSSSQDIIKELGTEVLIENLRRMLLIRNFEIRADLLTFKEKSGVFFIPILDKKLFKRLHCKSWSRIIGGSLHTDVMR